MLEVVVNTRGSPELWKAKRSLAKRDFAIRKICITLLLAINLAALGGALYAVISYCPFSSEAIIITPFIVGVVGALAYLKLPRFGVDKFNYKNLTNPAVQIGKALTFLFFGPFVLINDRLDDNAYFDAHVAQQISDGLSKWSFEQVSEEYGKHFKNLNKYGFIDEKTATGLIDLQKRWKPIKDAIEFYQSEYKKQLANTAKKVVVEVSIEEEKESEGREVEESYWRSSYNQLIHVEKNTIEHDWEVIKQQFVDGLPFPKATYDASNWGKVQRCCREFFLYPSHFIPEDKQAGHLIY